MPQKHQVSSQAIQVKNEELENYFSNTIIPQLFVDADLILRKFTPPAMTHFNLSKEDIGKNIELVKDNIKYPTVIENIQEVISTGEILEKEIQTTDGKWYQMNILPYKVRKKNLTNGVIITFVDISLRLRAMRDLEKLNAAHETLMFALSHDIRQPLAALTLLEEVLRHSYKQQDDEKFELYLKKLKSSSRAMAALVDSFVAANDSGAEWEKRLERLNIESTVADIITALKSEDFSAANYSCKFETSEILFSRNNLRSIVYNLLNNALKYKHPKRKLKLLISTKKLGEFVLFQVQDNGMGIAPDHLEKVFGKGERLNPYLEGTGMGLYIVKRMLESMGSRISLESVPGKGSTFSIYFKDKPVES